ncbi:MAG TPA: hypothetical protein VNV88_16140, partial [Candidatus Solibacter sp.]|nr:hypothetical protein [Candidatus Solibacter sp.]
RMKLNGDGSYHLYVWCGYSQITAQITASGVGTSEEKSAEFALKSRAKEPVPTLNLARDKVRTP